MKTLSLNRQNDKDAVESLQRALKASRFNPGLIDGVFGPATQAAVIAFQQSRELIPDGIVGPRTAFALGLVDSQVINNTLPDFTPTVVSHMFPFTQVDNIRENLPFVLDGLVEQTLIEKPMVLMAMATIRAETEAFVPISEYKSKYNTSPGGHPFDLYDYRKDIGNSRKGHGEKYKGRGFIQLTGRYNYEVYGEKIGLGQKLLKKPELANDKQYAAQLLAVFLKDKESAIKMALLHNNLAQARRLVNGGSHGLERFIETYQIGYDRVPDE